MALKLTELRDFLGFSALLLLLSCNGSLQTLPDDPGMQAGSVKLRYNNGMWAAAESNTLKPFCEEHNGSIQ
jgi:hypothetical protein